MDTRAEMEAELQSQLQVAANSALFPSTRLTQLIKDAHLWATGLFPFQALRRAKMTGTVANQQYYDMPTDFRSHDTIICEVDGKEYDRKNFEDFLAYIRDHPNTTKRIFAIYANRIFLNPTPSSNGSNNFIIWGSIQPADLSASDSETIFSGRDVEGNEAIVRKAFSVGIKRIDNKLSLSEEAVARGMLAEIFAEEQARTQRDQRLDHPKFDVPDYFTEGRATNIGQFSYLPGE